MTESPLRNLFRYTISFLLSFARSIPQFHSHFADETILVHALANLSLGVLGVLCPHLLDILQDHVTMPVKSLDTG